MPNQTELTLLRVSLKPLPRFYHGTSFPGIEIYVRGKLVYSSEIAARVAGWGTDRFRSSLPNLEAQLSPTLPGPASFAFPSSSDDNDDSDSDPRSPSSAATPRYFFPDVSVEGNTATIRPREPVPVDKDVFIRLIHHNPSGSRSTMLTFGFHTGFMVPGAVRVSLKSGELDLAGIRTPHDVDAKFGRDFELDLVFAQGNTKTKDVDSYSDFLDATAYKCLAKLVEYHVVKPDAFFKSALEEQFQVIPIIGGFLR